MIFWGVGFGTIPNRANIWFGMSQLPLPLPELETPSGPQRVRGDSGKNDVPRGVSSPEEENLQLFADTRPAAPLQVPLPDRSTQSPFTGVWPAALTWEAALAYTSLSPLQLRRFQKLGVISARRAGRNGARIFLRSDLDQLLSTLFAPTSVNIEEDFDFG